MATTQGVLHPSDLQSQLPSYLPASEDIRLGNFLMKDVVDDAKSQSVPVTSETLPKKPRQTRDRTLNESDWEQQRDLIITLFKTMTLGQVMEQMERRGFHAKIHVFKSHIRKWGENKKNFKASEKQAAIALRNNPLLDSGSITTRSIPPHRLKRYEKDLRRRKMEALKRKSRHSSKPSTGQTPSSSSPRSFQSAIGLTGNIGSQYVNTTVMNGKFLYSPSERPAELFYMRLQEYVQVRLQAFISPSLSSTSGIDADMLYKTPMFPRNLCEHLKMAHSALSASEILATFRWLDKACALAKGFLQQAHWRLLVLLADIRDLSNWDADLGKSIGRFFADMAELVFYPNSQHCVIQLFRLFLQIDQCDSVLETAGQVALDSVRSVAPNDGTVLALMHIDVFDLCRVSRLYDSAVRIANQNIDFCSVTFGPNDYWTRHARYELAIMHFTREEIVDARQALVALLQVYEEESVAGDDIYLATCLILGDCCLMLGIPSDATHAYSLLLPTHKWHPTSKDEHRIDLFNLERLEYCERMAHNIQRRRLGVFSPDDLPDNSVNPGSVPCKHADWLFEKCCEKFGW